jgi:iron complex outermembrane receptor protein
MKKTKLSMAVAILLSSTSIYAVENINLEAIDITSSSFDTKENQTTFSTELYTQKDIQNSNAKDLYDFFNSQTSIITMPGYGNPFSQKIDIRGYGITNGYQNVVITVNGRKLNNIDMTPQLLSSISLDNIENIEIIKGSGSVQYGDGTNAGIINIKTKAKNSNYIKSYIGNDNTKNSIVSLGYADDNIIINGFLDYFTTDGNRVIDNSNNTDEKYNKNKSLSLIYFPNDNLELRLNRTYANMNTKYANPLTQNQFYDNPSQIGMADWSGNTYSEQYLSSYVTKLGATYYISNNYNFDIDFFDEDKLSKYASGFQSNYEYKSLNSKFNIEKDTYKISFGITGFTGDRKGSDNTTTKENIGHFIASEYDINPNLKFSLGAREEKIDYKYKPNSGNSLEYDESLNAYDIGLNYSINSNNTIFINYNKSFQTPDIDRFFSGGFGNIPKTFNSFIKPAKVNTINLGYNNFSQNNKLKVTLFRSDLNNEIYYNSSTYTNTNIDKSHKYGLELFDKYKITNNIFASINYNYIIAKIDKEENFNDKYIPGVSKHNINLNLGWKDSKLSTVLSHSYRSQAYSSDDFANSATQKQKAYNSTDLSANYKYKSFEFFAKVQNIFDKKNGMWIADDQIYPINFERTYYTGIKYEF